MTGSETHEDTKQTTTAVVSAGAAGEELRSVARLLALARALARVQRRRIRPRRRRPLHRV